MKLEDLRTTEDRARRELEAVRAQLATAVNAVHTSERAKQELAAMRDVQKASAGAYRDAGDERARELQVQADGLRLAHDQRDRLRREEARILNELERTRVAFEKLGIRHTVLPMLDGIPEASPCTVTWDQMTGDGDARQCAHCKTTVLSLATADPERAATLVASCGADARFHRRSDGTILPRDCPTAASRQRFWTIAPTAALGFVITIGGVAFVTSMNRATATEPPLTQKEKERRIPDMHQFESPPPRTPPIPTTPPVPHAVSRVPPLRGATRMHIYSSFETLGGSYTDELRLTRRGDQFDVSLACTKFSASLTRKTTIPASLVDDFLDAVSNRYRIENATQGVCPHTDDYPTILVHVEGTTNTDLTVANCSYQWSDDGLVLEPDVGEDAGASEPHHPRINDKYDAIVKAAGTERCTREVEHVKTAPGTPRSPCNPPYDWDGKGHKVFKRECL